MIQDTEAIICNNDDMALGIYDYYKANQLDVPVILGINNSQEMNEKVLSGEIYGTVDNNVEDQVKKIDGLMRKVLEKNEADEPKIWYSDNKKTTGSWSASCRRDESTGTFRRKNG